MRECPEAVDAMIGSHAAFTKAAEAHIAGCQMYEDIVDTATAEATFRGDFFTDGFVLGKKCKEPEDVPWNLHFGLLHLWN